MSLRFKLIVIVASTMLLAMGVSTYLVRGLVYDNILRNKKTTVDILTASIVHDLTYNYDIYREARPQDVIAKYMTYYRIIRSIAFYDHEGTAAAHSDPRAIGLSSSDGAIVAALRKAKPLIEVTKQDRKELGIRSVAPLFRGSRIVGAIEVRVSIQDLQLTLGRIDRQIALIMGLKIIVVSALLFVLLRVTILSRIGRLMVATREITRGHYNIHVEERTRDELGQLARAFNRMGEELGASKRQLESHQRQLEERVREATGESQRAYENLKNAQSQLVLNEKMASLGVLIAGVAHEINTPVAAILNTSRTLESRIGTLPEALRRLRCEAEIPEEAVVPCLEEVIAAARSARRGSSYRDQRAMEALLAAEGVDRPAATAERLLRMNLSDPAVVLRHLACLRRVEFLELAEAVGTIAQVGRITEASSQKIAEIIRALKYYAYSDKDRVERIEINESVETALVLLRNRLKEQMRVVTDLGEGLEAVLCTSEIHQVWTNLITNACDAVESAGRGEEGEIRIRTRQEEGRIVVTVSDNGCGIPPEVMPKIFDPFFTTKDIGKGTGLGLCIVSGIVKKHGGDVRVDSRPGETRIEVSIPLRRTGEGALEDEAFAEGAAAAGVFGIAALREGA